MKIENKIKKLFKKIVLSRRLQKILFLLIVNSAVMYYAERFRTAGGNFSDGVLVGWLYGIVFCLSASILYLILELVYKNFKLRWKKEI